MAKQAQIEAEARFIPDEYVRGRVRALVVDLVNDDWSMALQDLERLYRALKTGAPAPVHQGTGRIVPDVAGAAIYWDDDGTLVEEFCQGPDERGGCPRAQPGKPVACAGNRLATRGWDFAVDPDAVQCPLVALGLVRRPIGGHARETKINQGPDSR